MLVYITFIFSSSVMILMGSIQGNVIGNSFTNFHQPIRPISCHDDNGNTGTCMFSLACRQSKGTPIGICKDTIYAGSCCQLSPPSESRLPTTMEDTQKDREKVTDSVTTEPSINRDDDPDDDEIAVTTAETKNFEGLSTASSTVSEYTDPETRLPPSTSRSTQKAFDPNINTQAPKEVTSADQFWPTGFETNEVDVADSIKDSAFNKNPVTENINSSSDDDISNLETVTSNSLEESTTKTVSNSTPNISPLSYTEQSLETLTSNRETFTTQESLFSSSVYINSSSPGNEFSSTDSYQESDSSSINKSTTEQSTETTTKPSLTTLRGTTKIVGHRPYDNKLDCGVRPLKSVARVVGGRNAQFGEWPWQVLIKEATWLGLWMKTKCGGVLIHHRWVLTAAHCQPGFWGSLLVVVGEYDLTSDIENLKPIQKPVKRMIVHRNYNPLTFENDIALMELESPFDIQPHVIPICLPEFDEEFVGKTAHVAGWGKLSYGGPIPSILQVVKVPILANEKCQDMFNKAGHDKEIKPTFLCAGYADGGKDSCEGDSGGPLMLQRDNGQWVLAGTVSHGIKCAAENLPGVYSNVRYYRRWIDRIIGSTTDSRHNKTVRKSWK